MNRSAKTFTLEGHKVMLLQYITPDLNDLLSGLVCMELNMTSTRFSLGNSCGMPRVYNQKVNNNNKENKNKNKNF